MKAPKEIEIIPESDVLPGFRHPRYAAHIFGHAQVEKDILAAYQSGRMPQSIILGGPLGIGKASLSWRAAKFIMAHPDHRSEAVVNARDLSVDDNHPAVRRLMSMSHGDLSLLRRAYNDKTKRFYTEIRVDDIRSALDKFHRAAGEGGWRIAIIDCADDLNKSSANALLKLIEEPPANSLFFFIAHHPARLLPTIRSRSRLLTMSALSADDVINAITQLPEAKDYKNKDIAQAAARAGGSVREALRLLDGGGLDVISLVERVLHPMPHVNWLTVFELSDRVCARDADDDFNSTITAIYDWLAQYIATHADEPVARLAPIAQVWEKIAGAVRHAEALNLDKRSLLLSIITDISEACAEQVHTFS